jgi:two-component system nitrogen regulation sensor histidine kinase GlnL
MKLSGIENKARLALSLFVLALLLGAGASLALYFQARQQLSDQRARQLELEVSLLASTLSFSSGAQLKELLQRNNISAAVALYSADGVPLASASTLSRWPEPTLLLPSSRPTEKTTKASIRHEGGFDIAEIRAAAGIIVMAKPGDHFLPSLAVYMLSYQVVALLLGLVLMALLTRWLLRPYQRVVEAARISPVRASAAPSEGEFVVETFRALLEQLQSKERELARLNALERERAEKSERFNERLIASLPSGLVAVDSNGFITSINSHAKTIFDPARQDGAGTHYSSLFKSAPKLIQLISECLSSGASFRREEVQFKDPAGRMRHLGLSISPIMSSSQKVEGSLCLVTDLTEVIELRERMKLQENLANLGEMAAGLAHEFKNSLATIQGFIQLIGQHRNDQAISAALNEVKLLTQLVTDFLNFARPQKLNLARIDLGSLIRASAGEFKNQLEEARIEMIISGSFPTITGDEALLRRAFSNLIRNAIEAIDPESEQRFIEITASVDQSHNPNYVQVRVRDTGHGIAPEDLHRIFIPFFTTKSRGHGIGLALVQKILMAHGGDVSAESTTSGTTFCCRLPITM